MKNIKYTKRVFAELRQTTDGKYKVIFADKLTKINQHKRKWLPLNARDFAREINKTGLIIK